MIQDQRERRSLRVTTPLFFYQWVEDAEYEDGVIDSSGRTTMGMKQAHVLAQDQQALKCPRCDSLNTKFCYYNNYSLSQPRHFCKACKRYWTRGGTLRSVPVGGGCRKNKRMKRPNSASDPTLTLTNPKSSMKQIGATRVPSDTNQLFYGLHPNTQSDINLTYPSFDSRVLNEITSCGYGDPFAASFSSMGMTSTAELGENYKPDIDSSIQIHDVISLNSNLANFPGFGSSSSTSTTSFTSLQPQDFILSGLKETAKSANHIPAIFPFKDMLLGGCGTDLMNVTRELKLEEEAGDLIDNKVDFGTPCADAIGTLDSPVRWNSVGGWPDLSNYGSSITSSF